jgi:hypothetical protein
MIVYPAVKFLLFLHPNKRSYFGYNKSVKKAPARPVDEIRQW